MVMTLSFKKNNGCITFGTETLHHHFFKVGRQGKMKVEKKKEVGMGGISTGGGRPGGCNHHDDQPESDNDSTPVALT